jgi:peptidoglycan/xylan/chitin deacetylase (PgdA/CDA1 family)
MQHKTRILHRLFSAAARKVLGTITHVSTQDAVVALTFDDGPHPEITPRLLDVLERHQAHATFFMIGEAAQRHPDLVQRVAQAGHAVGNHTWDHPSFPLISGRERRAQLRACEKAIAPYGQRLFRPPYGHQSVASRLDALWLGYQVVTWNIAGYDWLDHDAKWIADWLANQIKPGSVILLHNVLYHTIEERYADREPMIEAVNMLLERVGDCFRFITIPELFQHGRPQRQNQYWKADIDWLNKLRGREGLARRYAYGRECQ